MQRTLFLFLHVFFLRSQSDCSMMEVNDCHQVSNKNKRFYRVVCVCFLIVKIRIKNEQRKKNITDFCCCCLELKNERKKRTEYTYASISTDHNRLNMHILFNEMSEYSIVVFNQRARADCLCSSFANDERGFYLFNILLLLLLLLSDNSQNRHRVNHAKVLEQ